MEIQLGKQAFHDNIHHGKLNSLALQQLQKIADF